MAKITYLAKVQQYLEEHWDDDSELLLIGSCKHNGLAYVRKSGLPSEFKIICRQKTGGEGKTSHNWGDVRGGLTKELKDDSKAKTAMKGLGEAIAEWRDHLANRPESGLHDQLAIVDVRAADVPFDGITPTPEPEGSSRMMTHQETTPSTKRKRGSGSESEGLTEDEAEAGGKNTQPRAKKSSRKHRRRSGSFRSPAPAPSVAVDTPDQSANQGVTPSANIPTASTPARRPAGQPDVGTTSVVDIGNGARASIEHFTPAFPATFGKPLKLEAPGTLVHDNKLPSTTHGKSNEVMVKEEEVDTSRRPRDYGSFSISIPTFAIETVTDSAKWVNKKVQEQRARMTARFVFRLIIFAFTILWHRDRPSRIVEALLEGDSARAYTLLRPWLSQLGLPADIAGALDDTLVAERLDELLAGANFREEAKKVEQRMKEDEDDGVVGDNDHDVGRKRVGPLPPGAIQAGQALGAALSGRGGECKSPREGQAPSEEPA